MKAFRLVMQKLGITQWAWFAAFEKAVQYAMAMVARSAGKFPKTSFFLIGFFATCFEDLYELSGIGHKWNEMKMYAHNQLDKYVLSWIDDLTGEKPPSLTGEGLRIWAGRVAANRVGDITGFHVTGLYPPGALAQEVMIAVTGAIANGGTFEGMTLFTPAQAQGFMSQIQQNYNLGVEREKETRAPVLAAKRAWKNAHPQRAIALDIGNPLLDAARRDAVDRLFARWKAIKNGAERENVLTPPVGGE